MIHRESGQKLGKARRAAIIASFALAALLAGPPARAAADPAQQNAEQLAKLRSRIQDLQQSLDQDKGRQDTLRNQLEVSEQRYAALVGQLKGLKRQINEQDKARRKTEAQKAEAESQLARHRHALARQIRSAYVIGERGNAKLLLNQDRSQKLARVSSYYDYLARARVARMATIAEQVNKLEAISEALKQQTAALEATRTQQQNTLLALDSARGEREQAMSAIDTRIAGELGELKHLQTDEKELSHLIEQLRSALSDLPADMGSKPFASFKGKLPWPLRGKLLARFGEPKAGGRLKWNGMWISGNEGDPVHAIARGRVAYVGWMHAYGLIAVLEHEGGYYSLYGHNQNVSVAIGDWVQVGDVIASCGVTGGHEQAGVYFELRKGTDPVNPRPWLRTKG